MKIVVSAFDEFVGIPKNSVLVLFMTVKVEIGGYGVSRDSEIDLSENELWTQGIEV